MVISSLDKNIIRAEKEPKSLWEKPGEKVTSRGLAGKIGETPFNEAYDRIRHSARELIDGGRADEVIRVVENFRAVIERKGEIGGRTADLYGAMLQTLTAAYIEIERIDEAKRTAALTLTLLAQEPKRRDEPFLTILALTLLDLSQLHYLKSEYKQAEREIEKATKIFEKLAKTNAQRYAPAHMASQSATTRIVRSRTRQIAMLKENQEATEKYMLQLDKGMQGAASLLVDSLAEEGRTLAQMGKHREAVQYFSRALKYLTKIEPEISLRQLTLSVDLGEALIQTRTTHDKGVHLLNTMLHKAAKLNAEAEYSRIKTTLSNTKTKQLDILGFWYKLFPK